MSDETNQHNEELLYEGGKVKIVHNKVLGGWYIVRGPHQTPIGGRHDSKEAAKEHLNRKNEEFEQQHDENLQDMVISALDKKVTDFNAAFQNVMNMKLADRVATLKSDLATKLFNPGGPAPEPVATEEIQPEDDAEVIDEKYVGFKKLEGKLKGKVSNPAAVAASIGMKKYGKNKFEKAAHEGKKLKGK